MITIGVYDRNTFELRYIYPVEYTSKEAAQNKADRLNEYWHSPKRIFKADYFYSVDVPVKPITGKPKPRKRVQVL